MSALGANPSQLDAIAHNFSQFADDLDYRRTTLTAWIELDRFWRGNRASEFRGAWEHQFSPQLRDAVEFLRDHVKNLHSNANEQRVASGEQPKTYGAAGFLKKLFDEASHDAASIANHVAHDIVSGWHSVEDGAKQLWDMEKAGFHQVVSSKAFAETIGVLSVVSNVAGVVALIPIPVVQEAAGAIALGAGALVLAGHLCQMANTGTFKPWQLAADTAGLVSGGMMVRAAGAARVAGLARVPEAAGSGVNLFRAAPVVLRSDVSKVVAMIKDNPKATVTIGVRAFDTLSTAGNTVDTAVGDVRDGHPGYAAEDLLFGGVETIVKGAGGPDVTPLLELDHQALELGEGRFAENNGYQAEPGSGGGGW